MMEFTLARVCMSLCGIMLLAAVVAPVAGMYGSGTVSAESNIPDGIASVADSFYRSEMDTLTVPMSDLLPDVRSYVEFSGNLITLTTERGVYRSGTNIPIVVADGGPFGHRDILRLSKADGSVVIERLGSF